MNEDAVIRPSDKGATVTVVLLGVAGLLDLLALVSGVSQARLIQGVINGGALSQATASANDARQQLIAQLGLLVFIITAIAFLSWLHRAYEALGDVGTGKTRFSAGWSVGYWFVPVLNLVRPYQVVKDLWLRSGSGNAVEDISDLPSPSLVGLWWLSFIVSSGLGRMLSIHAQDATTAEQLLELSWWQVTCDAVLIVSALLAILVVTGIASRQRRMWDEPVPQVGSETGVGATAPADG